MINSISPIDGRYETKSRPLQAYFSESALIKYRVLVEIEYFIQLTELPLPQLTGFPKNQVESLRQIYKYFKAEDAEAIKAIEKETNHDVKAVEYFIKERFDQLKLAGYKEFIHFGLTSQDINNTAIPLSLKEAIEIEYIPLFDRLLQHLSELASNWKDIAMLARTHGQPASPTRLGKELFVFVERLIKQKDNLVKTDYEGKFGGATGNFNAHHIAYPEIDWKNFADHFISELGLSRQQHTTQIAHYDDLAAIFQTLIRINNILIDFCRDIWTYISMEYFTQKTIANEVGSSTMPHKVNPIDFENAEGNLGLANAIFDHLSLKLPISRLQRDLTDSTVLRNIGTPIAHSYISILSILKGCSKLQLNSVAIENDLSDNWAVVTEAYQSILRREGVDKPYELLKDLTRGKSKPSKEDLFLFIERLEISEKVKDELKKISPFNYLGI